MAFEGFIIHHSSCASINGSGYDFWIGADGSVTPAPFLTDPSHIHICLEGRFDRSYDLLGTAEKQQLFIAGKLILELSRQYDISPFSFIRIHPIARGKNFPGMNL